MSSLYQTAFLLLAAVLGLALAELLPVHAGISEQTSVIVGAASFFLVWMGLIQVSQSQREERLTDVLRRQAEKLKQLQQHLDDLERRHSAQSGEDSEKLVAELKVLQTLLAQMGSGGSQPGSASRESASARLKDAGATEAGGADSDWAAAIADDGAGGRTPAPSTKPRAAGGIRVVQDEADLGDILRTALAENRLDLYLQPIMRLPARTAIHFECFSRVRDEAGRVILPGQYVQTAERLGLSGTLDNLLLFRLIQLVRQMGRRNRDRRLFCNISKWSLEDDEFLPQFVDYMASSHEFVDRLVFEITQEDFSSLDDVVMERLQRLARKGYKFSFDAETTKGLDLTKWGRKGVGYLKVPGDTLLAEIGAAGIDLYKRDLRMAGVQLIGSMLEEEGLVSDLSSAGLEYGQGYIFGEPGPADEMHRDL